MAQPPIYVKKNVTVQTGANLHAQNVDLSRFQVKSAAKIVNKAISCLAKTHSKLKYKLTGDALRYSRRYFLFGPGGPNSIERNTMLSVIVLTWTGLLSDRTIVVDEHGLNPGARGWTSVIPVPANQLASVRTANPERNIFYDNSTGGYVAAGHINVSDDLLTGETKQGVETFIHEATHRYANTVDVGQSGISTNGVVYDAPGLTTMEALGNAESYGWFAYKVGR
jgi:hypothetical protein